MAFISVLFLSSSFVPLHFLPAAILKGPYLQNVRLDGITVMWETDSSPDGRVAYGQTESLGSFAEGTGFLSHCGRFIHETALSGLQSATRYYYRVTSGGAQSGIYTFHTAPLPDVPFTFAVYGDNRSNFDDYTTQHEAVVQSIVNHASPGIVIHTGDVVETGSWCEEVGEAFGWGPEYFCSGQALFGNVAQFIAIGNHEYFGAGDPANFQDYFSFPDTGSSDPEYDDLWYSFDYGNAHFVMINSNYYQVGGNFAPGSEQYNWLIGDLKTAAATWKFACFHHPPYSRLDHGEEMFPVREYLVPLFERYGVQVVFNGHVHFYERSRKRGIYYIVTGGGGGPLTPVGEPDLNPYSLYAESLFHHCRVEIDGTRLSFFALDTDGADFDSCEINLEEDEDLDGYPSGDEFLSSWDPSDPYSPIPTSVVSGDYDGDGTDELAFFRRQPGLWAVKGLTRCYFGQPGDWPVAGDYNGDGRSEFAIFRPSSGLWAIRGSTRCYWGNSGDIPVPADFNGDGKIDPAIFRPTRRLWLVRALSRFYLGSFGDKAVPADYDGDGTAQGAVFRMETGLWNIRSGASFYFGAFGDQPCRGDYDGDGTDDVAIFRSSSALWVVRGITRHYLGSWSDLPVAADYNGNGKEDLAVFRPISGLWAVRGITRIYFGGSQDIPVL